ncbi:MAG: DUF4116 domain-containing protein [Candidatus Gracilibacteria bacterium]|nr:DUF4116 domain-containing protein [Candidatus Gracilibacteria bacterium]
MENMKPADPENRNQELNADEIQNEIKGLYILESQVNNVKTMIYILADHGNKTTNGTFIGGDARIIVGGKLVFSRKCEDIRIFSDNILIQEGNISLNIRKIDFIKDSMQIKQQMDHLNSAVVRGFLLENLNNDGMLLGNERYEEFRNDIAFVFAAVKQNGMAMQFAGTEAKNNDEIIFAALNNNFLAFGFLSPEKKADGRFMMLYNELKRTCEYILSNDGISLGEEKLKNARSDKSMVMLAVKQNGLAIQFACDSLKQDPEIVLEAVKQNGLAYGYISRDYLKYSKEIVKSAIDSNILVYSLFDNAIKNNVEFMIHILGKDIGKYDILNPDMKYNINILAFLVSKNILFALNRISNPEMINSPEFISEVLRIYEKNILNQVINMDSEQILRLPDSYIRMIFENFKEVAIHWINITSGNILNKPYISSNIRYLLDLAITDSRLLVFFPKQLKNNPEFMRILIDKNPESISRFRGAGMENNCIAGIVKGNLNSTIALLLNSQNEKIKNLVQKIISTGDLNVIDESGYNLLMRLIESSEQDYENHALTLLDQENINVNQIGLGDYTALSLAITHKKTSVVGKLLDNIDLFMFKMPVGAGMKTIVWYLKRQGFSKDFINKTRKHPNYTLINKYMK